MQRAGRRSRVNVLVAACAASVVAMMFAMSGIAGATAAAGTTSPEDEATATLQIIEPSVSVRRAGAENFKPGREGQKLRVGDTVQTDPTGFAQVNYTDDSFTRLDVDTTFTIVSLTDDEGNRQIKGSVDSGQTWNRTSALTESESFEQEGAGATAAVTGTAFVTACDTATPQKCTFTSVVDGITLTTIDGELQHLDPLMECDATEVVVVEDANLCGAPAQVTLDAIVANAWILENLFIDGANGLQGIILVENGVVVGVTTTPPAPPPPPDETPPEEPPFDPPVIDSNPVNITDTGDDPTPGESTGENTKVSSQDEEDTVTFTLQVTGAHPFYIVFTALPDANFGALLKGGVAVDTVTHYFVTDVFTFDPVEMEPICNSEPEVLSDCWTNGNPEGPGTSTPYPTGADAPFDNGDGTVRWTDSFSFKAVNADDGDESEEATVTLEAVEDVCNPGNEGSRDADIVVDSCSEDA